jgi:hypothetical protein
MRAIGDWGVAAAPFGLALAIVGAAARHLLARVA